MIKPGRSTNFQRDNLPKADTRPHTSDARRRFILSKMVAPPRGYVEGGSLVNIVRQPYRLQISNVSIVPDQPENVKYP